MADVHLEPREAVQAHFDLRREHSIAMHLGTSQLAYEGIDQPQLDLARALDKSGLAWIVPGRSGNGCRGCNA